MPCLYRNMAKSRIVWLSLLCVVVCLVAFAASGKAALPPDAPSAIALQLACSEEAFHAMLDQRGAQGIRYYQLSTLAIDYVFPVAYAVLFSSLIALLGPRTASEPSTVGLACFLVPLTAAVLDWVENTLHPVVLSGAVSDKGAVDCRGIRCSANEVGAAQLVGSACQLRRGPEDGPASELLSRRAE